MVRSGAKHLAGSARPSRPPARPRADATAADDARRARRRAPGSRSGQQRPAQPGRLCQRCHLTHDRPHHPTQRRITYLLRRALGDLFFGPYGFSPGDLVDVVAKHAQAGKMLRGSETRGCGQEPFDEPSELRAAIAVLLEPSPKQEAHSIDGVLLTLTEATAREWLEDYGRSDLAGSLFKNGRIFIIRIEIDIRLLHRIDAAAEAAGMMEQA